MPRAVLDPNVLISGLISPGGPTGRILALLRDGAFELVTSLLLLDELDGVLRRPKFRRHVTEDEVAEFVDAIRRQIELLEDPPATQPRLSEDPNDEYLVRLARSARVDHLVSGDPHLTLLRGSIPVLTPREFLKLIERSDEQP